MVVILAGISLHVRFAVRVYLALLRNIHMQICTCIGLSPHGPVKAIRKNDSTAHMPWHSSKSPPFFNTRLLLYTQPNV